MGLLKECSLHDREGPSRTEKGISIEYGGTTMDFVMFQILLVRRCFASAVRIIKLIYKHTCTKP